MRGTPGGDALTLHGSLTLADEPGTHRQGKKDLPIEKDRAAAIALPDEFKPRFVFIFAILPE